MNFDNLKKYNSIVVIGAQRSGTQIASKIMAMALGKAFVHENEFDVHDFDKMMDMLDSTVVHAPALSHRVLDIPNDTGVVFVVRAFKDIIASQERVGWSHEMAERKKYLRQFGIALNDPRPICEIKHDVFFEYHYKLMNTEYLNYSWLESYVLFVDKEDRKNFTTWQTEK